MAKIDQRLELVGATRYLRHGERRTALGGKHAVDRHKVARKPRGIVNRVERIRGEEIRTIVAFVRCLLALGNGQGLQKIDAQSHQMRDLHDDIEECSAIGKCEGRKYAYMDLVDDEIGEVGSYKTLVMPRIGAVGPD